MFSSPATSEFPSASAAALGSIKTSRSASPNVKLVHVEAIELFPRSPELARLPRRHAPSLDATRWPSELHVYASTALAAWEMMPHVKHNADAPPLTRPAGRK